MGRHETKKSRPACDEDGNAISMEQALKYQFFMIDETWLSRCLS